MNQSKLVCTLAEITVKLIAVLKEVELTAEQRDIVNEAEKFIEEV